MQQINTLAVEPTASDEVKEAQRRLEAWGNWLRACTVSQLGFPNHAAFARMPSGITDYEDTAAEDIERILAEMMSMSPRRVDQYRALIQAYYFQSSTRVGAAKMHCDVNYYRRMLEGGENYVAVVLVERQRNTVRRGVV